MSPGIRRNSLSVLAAFLGLSAPALLEGQEAGVKNEQEKVNCGPGE